MHLKVLVVVGVDAEAGDEAVHHELHVGVLAAHPPPEGLGRIEQQRLGGVREERGHSRSLKVAHPHREQSQLSITTAVNN